MFSDPIADLFTRIRNGYLARKNAISVPFSKQKKAIADLLATHHYIDSVEIADKDPKKTLNIVLKYTDRRPAIVKIRRISKAGRRLYKGKDKLPYVLSGLGMALISTSQGIMTAKQARKKGIGGEVIGEIW